MQDILLVNSSGLRRLFRFVTPSALRVLQAAGWQPSR
jgi:hypothetical protein